MTHTLARVWRAISLYGVIAGAVAIGIGLCVAAQAASWAR